MAADDLFFLRTGEETRPFVQVRLLGDGDSVAAEASISDPSASGTGAKDDFARRGDLPSVLREARDHALLKGLDLRIELNEHSWPKELGILGNADASGD